MELLLDTGANIEIKFPGNQTILHMACCLGNDAAVNSLVERGCRIQQKDNQGLTPLDVATLSGFYNIATTIQKAIDSILSGNDCHQISGAPLSTFAKTEDHGKLPLRVVQ
jgi:ankyrin repeat protein